MLSATPRKVDMVERIPTSGWLKNEMNLFAFVEFISVISGNGWSSKILPVRARVKSLLKFQCYCGSHRPSISPTKAFEQQPMRKDCTQKCTRICTRRRVFWGRGLSQRVANKPTEEILHFPGPAVVSQTKTHRVATVRGGQSGRGGQIRTDDLYVPNVALYQAKLHPVFGALRVAGFVRP